MKTHDVLVLNRAWAPIHIIDWKDAMSNIVTNKANSLSHVNQEFIPYGYADWLQFSITLRDDSDYYRVFTAEYPVALPEIIVLTKYDRLPVKQVKYSRQRICNRDNNRCGYCGKTFAQKDLTMDHIIPKAYGGKKTFDNIISCCFPCNQRKRDRTPGEAGMPLKFKPHQPRWISPLTGKDPDNLQCESWTHFMRVS